MTCCPWTPWMVGSCPWAAEEVLLLASLPSGDACCTVRRCTWQLKEKKRKSKRSNETLSGHKKLLQSRA